MQDPRQGVQEFAKSIDSLMMLLKPKVKGLTKVEDAWRQVAENWFNEGFLNYRNAYEEATKQMMSLSGTRSCEPREVYDYMVAAMSHASFLGHQRDFKDPEFLHALRAVASILETMLEKEKEIDSYFVR